MGQYLNQVRKHMRAWNDCFTCRFFFLKNKIMNLPSHHVSFPHGLYTFDKLCQMYYNNKIKLPHMTLFVLFVT